VEERGQLLIGAAAGGADRVRVGQQNTPFSTEQDVSGFCGISTRNSATRCRLMQLDAKRRMNFTPFPAMRTIAMLPVVPRTCRNVSRRDD
jgi:hypothetical protein